MRTMCKVLSLLVVATSLAASATGDTVVTMECIPKRPYLEKGQFQQLLNFDLILSNHSERTLRVSRIEVAVFDEEDRLVMRKHINNGEVNDPAGFPIGKSDLAPRGSLNIYNPFFAFDPLSKLHRAHFVVQLSEQGSSKTITSELNVLPLEHQAKTDLILPLKGRILVEDGHDYFAHHRRIDMSNPDVRKIISDNPTRYAQDLCIVNERGELFRGEPAKLENWYGYGAPEYATGAGTVVLSVNNVPENKVIDGKVVEDPMVADSEDPLAGMGNAVIIDHGNGEFSAYAHMQPGSIRVRVGEIVKQGQMLGQMGLTGDGGGEPPLVHLHYQLMNSAILLKSGGLPSYFRHFRRFVGSQWVPVTRGPLETGEIVQSN